MHVELEEAQLKNKHYFTRLEFTLKEIEIILYEEAPHEKISAIPENVFFIDIFKKFRTCNSRKFNSELMNNKIIIILKIIIIY